MNAREMKQVTPHSGGEVRSQATDPADVQYGWFMVLVSSSRTMLQQVSSNSCLGTRFSLMLTQVFGKGVLVRPVEVSNG